MKTIVFLLILGLSPEGRVGGDFEIWMDMDSCKKRIVALQPGYNRQTRFACIPVTKEELENPKGRKEI